MKIATDYLSNIWDYDKFLQNYRTGILQMDGWVSFRVTFTQENAK